MSAETRLCDTSSMVVVHRVFRREFRLLHQMVGGVEPADIDRSAVVAKHLTEMVTALHHHHTGEDELLWPLLLERAALPSELLERMERQHETIGDLLEGVVALAPGWSAGPTSRPETSWSGCSSRCRPGWPSIWTTRSRRCCRWSSNTSPRRSGTGWPSAG